VLAAQPEAPRGAPSVTLFSLERLLNNAEWNSLMDSYGERPRPHTASLEYVMQNCGVEGAIKALMGVEGHDNAIRQFAANCAKQLFQNYEREFSQDDAKHLRESIEAAELFVRGLATAGQMTAAHGNARNVAEHYSVSLNENNADIALISSVAACASHPYLREGIQEGVLYAWISWDGGFSYVRDELSKLYRLEGEYSTVSG
jgi:hypothetical protein